MNRREVVEFYLKRRKDGEEKAAAFWNGFGRTAQVKTSAEATMNRSGLVAAFIKTKKRLQHFRGVSERVKHASATNADLLPGGLADHKSPKDFNPKSLAQGKKVEREHTATPQLAREIAMDHLTEDPDYYRKLEKMEKKAFWGGFEKKAITVHHKIDSDNLKTINDILGKSLRGGHSLIDKLKSTKLKSATPAKALLGVMAGSGAVGLGYHGGKRLAEVGKAKG